MSTRRTSPMIATYVGLFGVALVASCQTPPAPQDGPPPHAPPPTPASAALVDALPPGPGAHPANTSPAAPSPNSHNAPQPAADPVPEGPSSCPAGMVLIEGDYCTDVRHTCKVEWYAPQNKKRVCEQFEETSTCVGSKVKKRYCIDKFSWPNIAGERPEVMNNFYQAQVKCAAMGKRMCTESEWNFACEGPDAKPFPYGYVRDPKKCNGDHKWDGPRMKRVGKRDAKELARLWRGVPSGSQPECVSDFGVHDLPANNDEVVSGESPKAKFSSVNTGGPWYSGVRNQCRPKVYTHDEGFFYYFLGFRCCSAADGKKNDPRTKKQKREKWKFNRVESLARFSTDEMKKVLEFKKKGECDCKRNALPGLKLNSPSHICKTMCGTLLGPNAKDGDDSTRVPHKSRHKIKK